MSTRKPTENDHPTRELPRELSDAELEQVSGGGPHVRVINGLYAR